MEAGRFFSLILSILKIHCSAIINTTTMSDSVPNLRSGILKRFERDFYLDEDGIRRIEAVLTTEANKLSTPSVLVFHVQRDDDRFYETTNLTDVLNDPNISEKRIRYCALELRENDPKSEAKPWESDWIVRVGFEKTMKNKVVFRISTKDRTWALHLADQLEPQIERTFKSHKTSSWWMAICTFALAFFLNNLVTHSSWSSKLPHFFVSWFPTCIWVVGIIFVLAIIADRPKWVIKYFGPESVFLWGDETQSFTQREETRKNIFWVAIVGFLISVGAGVYLNVTQPPQNKPSADNAIITTTNTPSVSLK
jgi:hypothetical protein